MSILDIPNAGCSIYLWMFKCGLKHIQWDEIVNALAKTTHKIREKDAANYWRGWYKSDLYNGGMHTVSILNIKNDTNIKPFYETKYSDYPQHPFLDQPEITNRYVPCNEQGIPLIKWSNGCLSLSDAKAFRHQKYIGENLKGTKYIVLDIDGDHGDCVWKDSIKAFNAYRYSTHTLVKPQQDNKVISYHLTFKVDRVIPTMHFPNAHVDIIGNKCNSIRYFKNKKWNGLEPLQMTDDIWETIKLRIKGLEET